MSQKSSQDKIGPDKIGPGKVDPDKIDPDKIDPAIVAALFLEHEAELRRFLIGVLRERAQAQDALQATFAKMIERGHEVQAGSRKAWLFRVAWHEALQLKRRSNTGDRILRQAAWTRPQEEESSEEPVVRFEEVEAVRKALAELSPEQQQVVRMRVYEEKTFALIAAELQIPLGTALGRMRAALEKLRQRLHGHRPS